MKDYHEKSFVYILSNNHGNVLYIGSTDDLKKRLYFHKRRLISGFTKKYNVHKLVYFEHFESPENALKPERQLKGFNRAKKNKIIERLNPNWNELLIPFGQ